MTKRNYDSFRTMMQCEGVDIDDVIPDHVITQTMNDTERDEVLNAVNLFFEEQRIDLKVVGYKDFGDVFSILVTRR